MIIWEASRRDGRRYTYADCLTWDDDVRCELIGGVPYMQDTDTVPVHVLEGCMISLPDLFGP